MLWNGVVEFGSDPFDFGQTTAGYGWKVMMFVVVANVEGYEVERAVVGVGFKSLEIIKSDLFKIC